MITEPVNLTSSILLPVSVSHAESVFYAIVLALGNAIGLFGNTLVIAATIGKQSNHFKLDHGTVVFLRHLAISDVLFTLLYPIPIMVVYAARHWVFGVEMCYAIGLIISLPATANMNFILVMSLHRYVRCRFPMKVRQLTTAKASLGCMAMWAFSCTFPVYTLAVKLRIIFNVNLASCSFTFPKSTGNAILIFGTTVVPFVVIVSLNLLLWYHVRAFAMHLSDRNYGSQEQERKQNKKFRASYRQGLLTTSFITALFAVTWMPTVLRFAYAAFAGEDNLPGWVERVRYFYFFGSWGNPVIYAMINKGFQNYFKMFVNKLCRDYFVAPTVSVGKVVSLYVEEVQADVNTKLRELRKGSTQVACVEPNLLLPTCRINVVCDNRNSTKSILKSNSSYSSNNIQFDANDFSVGNSASRNKNSEGTSGVGSSPLSDDRSSSDVIDSGTHPEQTLNSKCGSSEKGQTHEDEIEGNEVCCQGSPSPESKRVLFAD